MTPSNVELYAAQRDSLAECGQWSLALAQHPAYDRAPMTQRLRLTYRITEPAASALRGPLAVMWIDAFAAAGMPLSRPGESRKPRIELGPALPPGATGEREVLDAWLGDSVEVEAVVSRLIRTAPPGLDPLEAEEIGERLPSLSASLRSARYRATFAPDALDREALRARVAALLAQSSIEWVEQRGERLRTIDLRAVVLDLQLGCVGGAAVLDMHLELTQERMGRPASVLAALGVTATPAALVRTAIDVDRPRVALRAWRAHGRFA
jgi:radical SAM-linked protein